MDGNTPKPEMPNELKQKIAGISVNELLNRLGRFTVTLFDEQQQEVSSGTLVKIQDRLFIATSAHNLSLRSHSQLQILPDYKRPVEDGILRPSTNLGRNAELDVGFLEIPLNVIPDYFADKAYCTLDQFAIAQNGSPTQLTVMLGTPTQFLVPRSGTQPAPFVGKLIAFASTPLSLQEWPTSFRGRDPDRSSDILMEYPDEGCTRLDNNEVLTLTTPQGFSGGGLWSAEFREDTIWTPESAKLIGIQVSWDSDQRIDKATQIVHWLNLLRSRVPELREHLEETFPVLRQFD